MAETDGEPAWLDWAKRLRTMAQTGLTYARDPYDIDRYTQIAEIALGMMALGAGAPIAQVRDLFVGEAGHATPKVGVRTAVFRPGPSGPEVLMAREMSDGLWTLPGGWADVDESPREAAAREVIEETGYAVRITRLLALYDKRKHPHPPMPLHIWVLYFEAEIISSDGSGGDGKETDAIGFFPRDALPPLSLKRALPAQIDRLFALHAAGPGVPTYFD